MLKNNHLPRVSIGMPVYNGERFIRKALDSLLAQTFTDFELIISDNASTDTTAEICKEYAAKDQRIRFFRQKANVGQVCNFDFVLRQARSDHFMWAAHDDIWASVFLERILQEFEAVDDYVVAVGCEAQYTVNGIKQPFFREGAQFYNSIIGTDFNRICHMLKYNYGNLFYSLYKRGALFSKTNTKLSVLTNYSLNEIAFFLLVVESGNWKVVPEVMFFKETNIGTYEQARWEKAGGRLPIVSIQRYGKGAIYSLKYHALAMLDITRALSFLRLGGFEKAKLKGIAMFALLKHFMSLLTRYKAPVS